MKPFLDKFRKLDARYVYMLLAAGIFILVAVDFFLVMRPQISLVVSINKKISQMKADITTLKDNKQRTVQFQQGLEAVRRDIKNFNAMVHKKDEVPAVLKTTSSLANEYGVKVDQLVPQAPDQSPIAQNEDGKFYGQTLFVRLNAGYHQVGRFLSRLERERVFWKMGDFLIEADPQNPQRHNIRMELKILFVEK